jgi:phenylalanyl-tRNA synthetase alpha chain
LRHKWQEVEFKPYDITLDVAPQYPGKIYPFQKILSQTRQVFLEMGFEEVFSPHIESCFWNFDALFQPQDHPARDMQDTFYLKEPQSLKIPKSELVSKIQSIHENGGDTGSLGWGMPWSKELAKKAILRAHATATTIRALAENPQPPRKVFCIERVFRREAVDFKHLPVFYQVDGIVIDKEASLASLFGILTLFYKKMGFEKIELRPSFFPYTEPSVEIFVYFKQKKQFVEMGGAGIFRPEVTLPFGCNVPVLAWGLGLERLAMLRFGLDDMRKIYMPSLKWIKELPSCL